MSFPLFLILPCTCALALIVVAITSFFALIKPTALWHFLDDRRMRRATYSMRLVAIVVSFAIVLAAGTHAMLWWMDAWPELRGTIASLVGMALGLALPAALLRARPN